MTTAQQQFIELLRSGLWGTNADPSVFPAGKTDWGAILRIAKEQTVAVIISDGIETLPQENLPSKEHMMKLMMLRVKTTQAHQLLNHTINQIISGLKAEGIDSVLLKGQGVASNYRKPESRSCGDIDLYTGLKGYDTACEIINKLNQGKHKPGIESDHHMHLSLNGVEVEVHRHADKMPSRRRNTAFQNWTQECLDANFGSEGLRSWDNGDTVVSLAPATFDAFFILHHAVRHMTTEGVGFRQICDWTMYLHRHHDEIDSDLLKEKLHFFKMEDIWRQFGLLAVNVLGLPKEELPLAPDSMASRKTEKLLWHLFTSGNFGMYDINGRDRSKVPYLKRKWRSFRYQSSRLLKLIGLFPGYALSYLWHWFTGALVRFARSR